MLASGTTLGPYKVLAPLGAGGMGEVYRAHDPRLERDIALKILPDSLTADATARARLIREARSAAALSHPNICVVHDVGEAAGLVYIAMELVEGKPLSEGIGGKPLPGESVIQYGAQIAGALAHAHERHVIHRDLKSGNVMVTPEGRVKILDFGLAKRVWEVDEHGPTQPHVTLTESGVVVGTPHYLAPEVLNGAKSDAVSDVWALGVVLYEMAAGTLPFRGRTTYELSAAIVNETPASLSDRVPGGLRAVIAGCLAKPPSERTQQAREVRAALEALQAGVTPTDSPAAEKSVPPKANRQRVPIAPFVIALVVVIAATAAWLTRERWLPRPRLHEVQLTDQSWEISVARVALSPDGRMLLYDDWRGLKLMDPATKETHDILLPEALRGQIVAYSWRPDSRSFVIGPYFETAGGGLWEISALSGKATEIRATGVDPKVSPDGHSIAFVDKGDDRKPEVWVMDDSGAGAHKLAEVARFSNMCWSPDGKRLAVIEGGMTGLTILDAERGSRWRALEEERFDWGSGDPGMTWIEPRRLVVSMGDSTTFTAPMNLYELRLDVRGRRVIGKPRRLTDWRDGSVTAFTLTSDHRRLALLRGWSQSDVYWVDLAPGGKESRDLRRLTLDNGDKYPAGWTPTSDGVFFSGINGGGRTYRQRLDSPTAELVDNRYRYLLTRWDGGKWLYGLRSSRRGNFARSTYQLTRTPVGGGAVEVVKEWRPTAQVDSTGWYLGFDLPPVESVAGAVCEWVDSTFVIWRLDPRAGAMSEIMRLGNRPRYVGSALSQDGEQLALCSNSSTIDLVDLRAKRVTALRARPTGAWSAADSLMCWQVVWLPRGGGLLVSTFSPAGLWHVELNGRATRLIARRDYKNPWVGYPQLSPDGRKVAFAAITAQSNVWLIEGLK